MRQVLESDSHLHWKASVDSFRELFTMLGTGVSWSGGERNHFYLGGLAGGQFLDVSGVSGLDAPEDSRAFAMLDFDRDGWLDVALVGLSFPRLELYRNEVGATPAGERNRFVALRFVGGNVTDSPSEKWTARAGFGARIELTLEGGRRIVREHRVDDGFKTQHTQTMLIGIGAAAAVEAVTVTWPSGQTATSSRLAAGTLTTVYENRDAARSGTHFVTEAY